MKTTTFALFLVALLASHSPAADRPNIVWLSTEDISCHLGCYGDAVAKTPTLDSLAAKGIRYDNACTHAPVCAVVRSGIITGVYPVSLGTHHMRSRVDLPPEIGCFTARLREAGYYCTNNSKQDYNFQTPKNAWDESSGKAHWKKRPDDDQPFFAVFNYTGTHESRVRGDRPAYQQTVKNLTADQLTNPADIVLPPYHPDTPAVRKTWAQSYNTIAAMDDWVADHLKQFDEAGLADDTIVVFWSDHGSSLPRGKRWLYDSGVKIPLIVYVPEKYRSLVGVPSAGVARDELVSSIDFAPTMLNLAGLPVPGYMQGRAFLGPNLTGEREEIILHRDRMDERYDIVRAVRTKRFKYIRNFMPWRPGNQWVSYGEVNPILKDWRRLEAEGKLTPVQAAPLARTRPPEELYDLELDPHETKNLLLEDPNGYDQVRGQLQSKLEEWMVFTRDLGLVSEAHLTRLPQAQPHRYQMYRRPGGDEAYRALLKFALVATQSPAGSGILEALQHPDPAARPWGARAVTSLHADGWPADAAEVFKDCAPLLDDPSSHVVAAELLMMAAEDAPHIAEFAVAQLISVLDSDAEGWARLQAVNAIDLIPNFDRYADQLRPVVNRVRDELKNTRGRNTSGAYVNRCLGRLNQRLQRAPKESSKEAEAAAS